MCSRLLRPLGLPIYVARVPAAPFIRCFPHNFILHDWVFFEIERRTATLLQRERRRHACPYSENAGATPAATRLRLALAGLRRGKQIAEFIHHKPLMIGKFPADARSPEDESCFVLHRTCK